MRETLILQLDQRFRLSVRPVFQSIKVIHLLNLQLYSIHLFHVRKVDLCVSRELSQMGKQIALDLLFLIQFQQRHGFEFGIV